MFNNIVNNISLSRKYIYSIIFIIMIPFIILATAYFFKSQKTIEDEISLSYEQIVNQYVANIKNKLDLYRNIEEAFSVNGVVQEILWKPDASTPMDIMNLINKFTKETKSIFIGENQEEVYNITLYTYNKELLFNGEFLRNVKYSKDEEWFIDIERNNNSYNCHFKTLYQNNQQILLLSRPIIKINPSDYKERLGIIQISLLVNRVFKPTNGMPQKNGMEVFIQDKYNNIVYGDNTKAISLKELLKGNNKNGVIKDTNAHKIIISRPISPYGLKAVAVFSYNEVTSKVNASVRFSILIFVIILIISFGLTVLFSNIFTKRIHLLIKKMKKVEAGDLNISNVIEGEDEVGLLDRQFNRMVCRLESVISENCVQRLEKREAELSALQLQINPHFLYNTLESISAIAAINDCFDICSISQKLGDMFRYSINTMKNEFVFLRDEINHIKNYIFIQEIRFDGRFEVQYNIPEILMDCKILKFILQPIVENAISHGLEEKEVKGCITISAENYENVLYLTVKDDGAGMSHERLEQLNAYFNESDINTKEYAKRSIGLKNVDSRIKMVNGNAYGVTVNSQIKVGTQVVIKLPYCRKNWEDANV